MWITGDAGEAVEREVPERRVTLVAEVREQVAQRVTGPGDVPRLQLVEPHRVGVDAHARSPRPRPRRPRAESPPCGSAALDASAPARTARRGARAGAWRWPSPPSDRRLPGAPVGGAQSMPSIGARNRPVWLSGVLATCSGVPSAIDPAAAVAALGAEVDDPVGRLDDVEVVLDHEHGVAGVDQPLQHAEQPAHVLEVEAGGGLVEDVDACARWRACRARSRASPAAPRRPTAWARAGRGARSRARRRPASAGAGRSSAGWRRTRAPPRSTGRAPRRCSCP